MATSNQQQPDREARTDALDELGSPLPVTKLNLQGFLNVLQLKIFDSTEPAKSLSAHHRHNEAGRFFREALLLLREKTSGNLNRQESEALEKLIKLYNSGNG